MKASDKTVEFCKDWIEGKLTKSQHMHYYIVKAAHTEFMMKRNDRPDLVAIKDSFGHVFIPDDALQRHHFKDERCTRNPFFTLLSMGYVYRYSLLTETNISDIPNLSKWETLDHKVISHQSNLDINLSLIKIGETFYTTEFEQYRNEAYSVPLEDWANFIDIKKLGIKNHIAESKIQPYSFLSPTQGKPGKIDDCRQVYVDYAGDFANTSEVKGDWIIIPSDKTELKETLNNKIYDILKTRPLPYQYAIPEKVICNDIAINRTDYPFNPEISLLNYDSIASSRDFINSGEQWGGWLVNNIEREMAIRIIAFINDDDYWLRENAHIITPMQMGVKYCEGIGLRLMGHSLLIEEPNPSISPNYVLYIKGMTLESDYNRVKAGRKFHSFVKLIPAPHSEHQNFIKGFFNRCM